MIFGDQYPDANPGDRIECEGDELLRIARADFCWDCGRVTYWVSTSFHAPLCSDVCIKNKWKEYWEAVRR